MKSKTEQGNYVPLGTKIYLVILETRIIGAFPMKSMAENFVTEHSRKSCMSRKPAKPVEAYKIEERPVDLSELL